MRHTIRVILALALWAMAALSQSTTQQISGSVKDRSGAVVTSAKVQVLHVNTGQVRGAGVNESGNYVILNIPIGDYDITVEAPGFKKFTQKGLRVDVNSRPTLDVVLEVGALSDSVTVTADAAQVEASTGEVGRLITGDQAVNTQLNGRNYMQLLALIPGVTTSYTSGMALYGGYGNDTSSQNVNGLRSDSMAFNIDGVDNLDRGGNGNNFVNVNPDAIAEVKVLTSNYSAEQGQSSGAVVNMALKSGTREFHGAAYEYIRNDAFDARQFNSLTKPELRFNNFGWNLGGPIYIPGKFNADTQKLFFFGGMEFKRQRSGSTNTWVVPAMALRGGDFSSLSSSQWPKDPSTGVAYPNGVIPQSQLSQNMVRLIRNYPAPNFAGSGGNFVFQTVSPGNFNQYLMKVDYNISPKHQLSLHYVHDYYEGTYNLTQLVTYKRRPTGESSKVQWTWVVNPSTVNTLTASSPIDVIHQDGFQANPLFITDYTRKGEGITLPMIYGTNNAIPTIGISGYSSLNVTPVRWNNLGRLYTLKDDFSKVLGNHTLKAGILAMVSRKNQDSWPTVNGSFSFNTSHSNSTGNALGDALVGNFYEYLEANRNREGWYRFAQVEPYIQDDWKVSSRLTVNLGFRYQYMQPQYCALQNCVLFLPQYYNSSKAASVNPGNGAIISNSTYDPYNGLTLGGTGFPQAAIARISQTSDPAVKALFRGIPKEMSYTDFATPAPRLGFAYDLTGKQATVVRGGFGVFNERAQANYMMNAINNPPFIAQSDIYNGNVENPTGGTQQTYPSPISYSHPTDLKVARVMNWSLGVQHKIDSLTTLDVTYVGSSAANLLRYLNINQLPAGTVQQNPGVNSNALRPYLGYSNIYEFVSGANSVYNSLQVNGKRQMKNGGLLNAAYTWSRNIANASDYGEVPTDSYNFRGERGLTSFHRAHVFVLNYIYPLPFWTNGTEWYKRTFGGWQLSGVTTIETGEPLNLGINPDQAGIGQGGQRPNVVGDWSTNSKNLYHWFNTSAFALPAAGTFGNLGRNVLIGPSVKNWDASLQKFFAIREGIRAQFRAEVFDAPNHLSWWSVATTLGNSNFGQVTGTTDPRTFQFSLRLFF